MCWVAADDPLVTSYLVPRYLVPASTSPPAGVVIPPGSLRGFRALVGG